MNDFQVRSAYGNQTSMASDRYEVGMILYHPSILGMQAYHECSIQKSLHKLENHVLT
jgi:hypothetical protein